MGRLKKEKHPAQNQVEDGGLLPCTDEWCESYHDGSARNCLKEVGDFIVCPDRTRPEPTSNEVQKQEPSPELAVQECRNDACKHYNRTFVLNCENASSSKQKLSEICKFEVNSNPVPESPAEENHQENITTKKSKQQLKRLQIILEERDAPLICWIDMMAAENRRDRNGQIMTMLENMMLRDMEAA